ncbi:hypothetical protein B9Z19DRAFT_966241 [Tuber borchii]|uniref:Uncharacterized protein n=1 Tax=Tuber borchii TaxID=42251 RepID=A0A2T7A5A6_TUBBO|nr:hypothetical protein B9Z19DRAFT_966241 [Tuber borchii]
MVNAKKSLQNFINDGIPASKLTGFPESAGTIYSDQNFRLDMQGKTTDGKYNLQIQINRGTKLTTLKKAAPATVAGPVLATGTESAETIRANFRATMKL